MSYLSPKKKENIGLSPYDLKFRGRKRADNVRITVFDISPENVTETQVNSVEELRVYRDSPSITWINVDGLHNEQLIGDISTIFSIPAYILSDVMEPSSRPQT